MKEIHISLTGHRPTKLGGYDLSHPGYLKLQADLEQYIRFQLKTYDRIIGHSGLALGADTIWSKAILAMKEAYPSRVLFHAEIPMMSQSSVWFKKTDIDFWHHQVASADFTSVYGDMSTTPEAQQKRQASKFLDDRNHGMLDHADILLAVWDGNRRGGTYNAVSYAKTTKLETVIIDPSNYF